MFLKAKPVFAAVFIAAATLILRFGCGRATAEEMAAEPPCATRCSSAADCDDGDPATYELCENPATCDSACVGLSARVYNTDKIDTAFQIALTQDGGYAVAGSVSINGSGATGGDIRIVRLDSSMNKVWGRTCSVPYTDTPSEIIRSADGGFVVSGTSIGLTREQMGSSARIFKLDASGNLLWSRQFSGSMISQGTANDVIETSDGGYLAAGDSDDYAWAVKLDRDGKVIWETTYEDQHDRAFSVAQAPDGGFVFTGHAFGEGRSGAGILVFKTNSRGDLKWRRTFYGKDWRAGHDVFPLADGGWLVNASILEKDSRSDLVPRIYLMKLDGSGKIVWEKKFEDFYASGKMAPTPDGGYAIGGDEWRDQQAWGAIVKLDPDFNVAWKKSYKRFFQFYHIYSVTPLPDGGFIAAGNTMSGFHDDDMLILKVDHSGDLERKSIK